MGENPTVADESVQRGAMFELLAKQVEEGYFDDE